MSVPISADAPVQTLPPAGSWIRRTLWRFSSPWISLCLLALVFIHQALGSAGYVVRQHFEVNEMEWFNGWLSLVLWGLICLGLISASMLRIPWRWSRIGAHLTHLGVVSMVASSTWYFAHKIEGEAFLFRHYIDATGPEGSCRLLPKPGYAQSLGKGQVQVMSVIPEWPILSYPGGGKTGWAVMVKMTFGESSFIATLIEDHPELTQYTLDGLRPTSYLKDYPRVVAQGTTLSAFAADGVAILPTPLRVRAKSTDKSSAGDRSLEITKITPDFPLLSPGFEGKKGTLVEWTLKTPVGQENGSSILDQPTMTRFQSARVKQIPDGHLTAISLSPAPCRIAYYQTLPALWVRRLDEAHDDSQNAVRAVTGAGVWHLPLPTLPRYHDHGDDLHAGLMAIDAGTVGGVHFTITGFSPYAEIPTWVEDQEAPLRPLIMVDLSTDDPQAQKVISKTLAMNDDPASIDEANMCWVHAADATRLDGLVARLQARFPESAQAQDEHAATRKPPCLAILSGPDDTLNVWVGQVGQPLQHQPLDLDNDAVVQLMGVRFTIHLRARYWHPRRPVAPIPVPPQRQESRSSVGSFYSFIKVTARIADDTHPSGTPANEAASGTSIWVPYTPFPHLSVMIADSRDEDSSAIGMNAPNPRQLDIPGIGSFELEFSRELLPLPGDLWMTGFNVPRRPGSASPTEFFCTVGYGQPGGSAEHATIHMNAPLSWLGLFFFQAAWDEKSESFTILGVGNRPGGAWMLASAIVLALGMTLSGFSAARRRSPRPAGSAA